MPQKTKLRAERTPEANQRDANHTEGQENHAGAPTRGQTVLEERTRSKNPRLSPEQHGRPELPSGVASTAEPTQPKSNAPKPWQSADRDRGPHA
jgi:hypothetical protein